MSDYDVQDIFTRTEQYLSEKYDIRYNEISNDFECKNKKSETYSQLNDNQLYIELQKRGIKISQNNLIALLKSDFITKRYNPFREYFEKLPEWDGKTDHIQQLTSFVDVEEKEAFQHQFKKWIVRAVGTATLNGYVNKQCLTLVGGKKREQNQNTGKSTFCRFLVPEQLKSYLKDNLGTDKDSRIDLTRNLMVNLDELESLGKRDVNSLKSLFSLHQINDRLPYDRKNTIMKRTASFIGSTNMAEFLVDETGSVRWLCFRVNGIDWNYKKEVDINKVWSQATALLHDRSFDEQMTREEIKENEDRNDQYQQRSSESELLYKFFEPATKETEDAFFMQPVEIVSRISQYMTGVSLKSNIMGKACTARGMHRTKYKGVYGYWVKPLDRNMLSHLREIQQTKPFTTG